MKNEIKRRNFITKIGLSIAGFSLLSFTPIKLFAKLKKQDKININIHPYAIKRNKLGKG